MNDLLRVCVVEREPRRRESLAVLLSGTPGYVCVGRFGNARTALARIPALKPDVVLMDLQLPDRSGVECTFHLKSDLPDVQILVLTVEENPERVFEALEAGAGGYLLKGTPPARILEAIQELVQGGAPMSACIARLVVRSFHRRGRLRHEEDGLTRREREILDRLAAGCRTREIATQLSVSPETVHTHLNHLYEKLKVRSRTEAVARHLRR